MAKLNQGREELKLRHVRFLPKIDEFDKSHDYKSCDLGVTVEYIPLST